jgi:inorganic triphosphatase YgiF
MAGQAVTHIHLPLLKSLHNHEAGIRTHGHAEFLHDFRVAVRRTRAILTQIKYIYPDEIVRHIRFESVLLDFPKRKTETDSVACSKNRKRVLMGITFNVKNRIDHLGRPHILLLVRIIHWL